MNELALIGVFDKGTITKTGNYDLAIKVEENGYYEFKNKGKNITKEDKDE